MTKKSKKREEGSVSISIGGDVGPGAAVGPKARVTAKHIAGRDVIIKTQANEVADAFARIYAAIDARSFPTEADAQAVREAVELVEEENDKGDEANEKITRLSFSTLAQMAPDIWEVAVTTLCNPIQGISIVVRKIAEKAKAEIEAKKKASAGGD